LRMLLLPACFCVAVAIALTHLMRRFNAHNYSKI
jgi:hypothetical protein